MRYFSISLKAFVILLILFVLNSSADTIPPVFGKISVSSEAFNPTAGEETCINYYIRKDGKITISIYDADGYLVRTLRKNAPAFKGTSTACWDGKDDNGNIVPDEAYYFVIKIATTATIAATAEKIQVNLPGSAQKDLGT